MNFTQSQVDLKQKVLLFFSEDIYDKKARREHFASSPMSKIGLNWLKFLYFTCIYCISTLMQEKHISDTNLNEFDSHERVVFKWGQFSHPKHQD